MSEEKKVILEMLKDGKINVSEAEKLLEGIEEGNHETASIKPITTSLNKKFFKILVVEGDKTKVNINIPIALADAGLKLIPQDKLNIEGIPININDILKLIKEGAEGELINVETNESGKEVKVKIFIE